LRLDRPERKHNGGKRNQRPLHSSTVGVTNSSSSAS
jgi:hypothetical protein